MSRFWIWEHICCYVSQSYLVGIYQQMSSDCGLLHVSRLCSAVLVNHHCQSVVASRWPTCYVWHGWLGLVQHTQMVDLKNKRGIFTNFIRVHQCYVWFCAGFDSDSIDYVRCCKYIIPLKSMWKIYVPSWLRGTIGSVVSVAAPGPYWFSAETLKR